MFWLGFTILVSVLAVICVQRDALEEPEALKRISENSSTRYYYGFFE